MGQYEFDIQGFTNETMSEIHNSNLPQEIKDAWIEMAMTFNVGELRETVFEETLDGDIRLDESFERNLLNAVKDYSKRFKK